MPAAAGVGDISNHGGTIIGPGVRRRHQRDPTGKQPVEQPAKQHGVGDVGDLELIQTQYLDLSPEVARNDDERVFLALQLAHAMMNVLHEAMEMKALLGDG